MKKLNILILMVVSAIACSEDPYSAPDFSSSRRPGIPVLDLEEEASTIPWEFISGQIIYANQRTGDIVLIKGDTQKLIIIVKDKLANLIWHPQHSTFSGFRNDFHLNWDIGFGKSAVVPRLITYLLTGQQLFPNYSYLSTGFAWSSDLRIAHTGINDHYAYIDNTLFASEFFCNTYSRPAWSPDNEYLVFSQRRNDPRNKYALLVRINVSDTTKKILIQNEKISDSISFASPIFSPDGKNILYNRLLLNTYGVASLSEIWVMSLDGTNQQRLTADYLDGSPVWSPNGEKIIFSRQSPVSEERGIGSIGMFMMNNDGSGLQQILSEGSISPSWKP